ncbi:MAG: Tyrosine-protein kinase etk [Elusimicrobia bacterium ADurb.Bin231]|nr:MAG: Tyrosine-protein kinase etk [Elusimicrobia bacterium ADurb.Bin231]
MIKVSNTAKAQELQLEDYIQLLFRRKWIFITFFIIVVTIVAIATFRMRPVYRATATLLIEKESTPNPYQENVMVDVSQLDYYMSQYKIMKSRTLAKKVIDELKLEKHEEFIESKNIIDSFLKRIYVEPDRGTRLVKLSAESYYPNLAAKMANTLADAYMEQNLENKLFASKEILKRLPDSASDNWDSGKEDRLDSLPSVVNNTLIQSLKANYIKLETEYADLSKRYKDKHPSLVSLRAEMEQLKNRIDIEIKNIVESIKFELSGQLKTNNVRIIDPAEVPQNPIKPKKKLNILLAIIVGLLGGSGLAFFVDYTDNTIKTQQDIEQYLIIPFLGFIPKLTAKNKNEKKGERKLFVVSNPHSPESESLKSIRSNVTLTLPDKKFKTLLITSAGPEEGKTIISSNLSVSFANMGERTLLVDCDLRRPAVSKVFQKLHNRGMGDYLTEEAGIDDIVHKTDIENFSVIFAGKHKHGHREILHPLKIKKFIEEVKTKYDVVVFDSPPVMSVNDSMNIAICVDGIVQVIRYGKLNRKLVERCTQVLSDTGTKIIGAVLNGVDTESRGHYYYYYYYNYYGKYGYGNIKSDKERDSTMSKPAVSQKA